MRWNYFLPIAILSFAAVLPAQVIERKLKWVRETIDAHAVTHHIEPSTSSSETKWQVSRIDGCNMELKEKTHREVADSVITKDEVFGLSEDKVVTWSFDLTNLLPQYIMGDIVGGPHVGLFAQGDVFHSNTEVVSRVVKRNGDTVSTSNWSAPGTAPNLWIYFDSPAADNSQLVRRVEFELRSAVQQCAIQGRAH